jgi:hypothetical protein
MADTLNAITLSGEDWEDVNALTSIAVGTSISVQNQTNQAVFIAVSATKPALSFVGIAIPAVLSEMVTITEGENKVWLKGKGPVSIQVN